MSNVDLNNEFIIILIFKEFTEGVIETLTGVKEVFITIIFVDPEFIPTMRKLLSSKNLIMEKCYFKLHQI